ncbi:ABC transporter ATP-binding protein [Gephyromycinifex aptenodytis]|uniref:ABC transporter ATP-binding protein n=1 Tax=Gephyromycinifex aptenodytis TaxID=2716227 RepID=UPI001B2FEA4A|nr:ABC transporter ATP-binding protein [Gephyromycinifex aptenodytis]
MISLSASEPNQTPEKPGFLVGGAFSMGSRRDARRAAANAEPKPELTFIDNSQRTDLAVSVQHLSITYRTTFERVPTFKNAIVRAGRGERALVEVEAVKDVSFDVPNGTSLGIIGANGAGKSTIMRALAGILPPTTGRVEVWGRASTLLALGVGFNSMLSGRENVILGGLASGLTRKEVEERADAVAEWAELGDYIDAPMRTYSSGMFSRLAFSVAVHMKPDILMIDEALSAGDAAFREKANAKMDELRGSARAVFLVSHGLSSIRDMCNDCIWLHKGQVMMHGKPNDCIDAYTQFVKVGRTPRTMDEM